jgi:hypothetical protein
MSRRYSMVPYMAPKPIERVFPSALRSQAARRLVVALPSRSRLRRALILRVTGWFYRRFNSTGEQPDLVLAPDVRVDQTAALFDSAGTFSGPDGFEAMLDTRRRARSRGSGERSTSIYPGGRGHNLYLSGALGVPRPRIFGAAVVFKGNAGNEAADPARHGPA